MAVHESRGRIRLVGAVVVAAIGLSCAGCSWMWNKVLESNPALNVAAGSVTAAASKAPIGLEEEESYGDGIAIKIAQRYGGIVEDPSLVRYVALVGNAVALNSRRPELHYHFGVLNSEAVNATSAPGGWVFVTMGALRKMDSEAQLAGVLAHEITHITLRHALAIIKDLKAMQAMGQTASRGGQGADFYRGIIEAHTKAYLENGMGAELEYQSDAEGTKLLAKVGYDPRGLRNFLAKIAPEHQKELSAEAKMLGETHPDTHERIHRIDQLLATMKGSGPALKERFIHGTRALSGLSGEHVSKVQHRKQVALSKTIVKEAETPGTTPPPARPTPTAATPTAQ